MRGVASNPRRGGFGVGVGVSGFGFGARAFYISPRVSPTGLLGALVPVDGAVADGGRGEPTLGARDVLPSGSVLAHLVLEPPFRLFVEELGHDDVPRFSAAATVGSADETHLLDGDRVGEGGDGAVETVEEHGCADHDHAAEAFGVMPTEERETRARDFGIHVGDAELVEIHDPDVLVVGEGREGGLEKLEDLHAVLGVRRGGLVARHADVGVHEGATAAVPAAVLHVVRAEVGVEAGTAHLRLGTNVAAPAERVPQALRRLDQIAAIGAEESLHVHAGCARGRGRGREGGVRRT